MVLKPAPKGEIARHDRELVPVVAEIFDRRRRAQRSPSHGDAQHAMLEHRSFIGNDENTPRRERHGKQRDVAVAMITTLSSSAPSSKRRGRALTRTNWSGKEQAIHESHGAASSSGQSGGR